MEESPSPISQIEGKLMKEYWGEGSARARNWQRYVGQSTKMTFVEGVDSYINYEGKMADMLNVTLSKIRSTMSNCGAVNLVDFYKNTRLTVISPLSLAEGSAHSVVVKG